MAGKYDIIKQLFPQISHLIRFEGYTNDQLIDVLPISKNTFYKYIYKYPEFYDLLNENRAVLVNDLERAYIKEATGYEYVEVEEIFEVFVNKQGVETMQKIGEKRKKKFKSANTKAIKEILTRLGSWNKIEKKEKFEITDEIRRQVLEELMSADKGGDIEF